MSRATFIVAALAVLAAFPLRAQEDKLKDRVDLRLRDPDLSAARFAGPDLSDWDPSHSLLWRGRPIAPADAGAGTVGFLTLRAETLYGLERVQLTPFDMALEGAATGATLGLFAGAVGGATGWWDERASWAIVGGLAAFGAIMGAKKGLDEPTVRLRFDDER